MDTPAHGAGGLAAVAAGTLCDGQLKDSTASLYEAPPLLEPLPDGVARKVLMSLSPVERVQVEGVCKGWLTLFRSPLLWRDLDFDELNSDLDRCSTYLGADIEDILAAVAKRSGSAGLRSFTGDEGGWELDYTRLVEEILRPYGALSLERITVPSFYRLEENEIDAATLATFAAGVPTLREFVVKGVDLFDISDGVRTLLAADVQHCASELHLKVTADWFQQQEQEEDIETSLIALGTALSHGCGWRTVDVCCDVPFGDDEGLSMIRASQFVAMLAAMEHQSSLRLLQFESSSFDIEAASWITRAAARVNPPVSVRFRNLQCLAMDVRFLPAALAYAGSVTDFTFTFLGEPWHQTALNAAFSCFNTCIDSLPFDGDPPRIDLDFRILEQSQQSFSIDAALALAGFLHLNVSSSLYLGAHTRFSQPSSWRLVAGALSDRLTSLTVSSRTLGAVGVAVLALRLPVLINLTRLDVGALSVSDARVLAPALRSGCHINFSVSFDLDFYGVHLAMLGSAADVIFPEILAPVRKAASQEVLQVWCQGIIDNAGAAALVLILSNKDAPLEAARTALRALLVLARGGFFSAVLSASLFPSFVTVLLSASHVHDCDAWPALIYLVYTRTSLTTLECNAVAKAATVRLKQRQCASTANALKDDECFLMLLLLRVCGRTKALPSEAVAALCANPGRVLQAVCRMATISSARAAPLTAADSASKLLAQVWTLEDAADLFVAFADVVGGTELTPATVNDLFKLMSTPWVFEAELPQPTTDCTGQGEQLSVIVIYAALVKLLSNLPSATKCALWQAKFASQLTVGAFVERIHPSPAASSQVTAAVNKLVACLLDLGLENWNLYR